MGKIYFPILMGRLGEIDAAGRLSPRARSRSQIMFDPILPRKGGSLEVHLTSIAQAIARTWGTSQAICLDLSRYDPELLTESGKRPVEFLFHCAHQCHLKPIPVSGPASVRGPGTAYIDVVRHIAERGERGAALRIPFDELVTVENLNDTIDACLRALGLHENHVDLYLDCGVLWKLPEYVRNSDGLAAVWNAAFAEVRSRPFRHVTFGASSIPGSFRKSKDGKPHRVVRTEMVAWHNLGVKESTPIGFSDYGARYAHQTEADKPVNPPSRVSLASVSDHVLYRAARIEHRRNCREASGSSEFIDQANSWGKLEIRDCGLGNADVGVPQDWAARDTNMHIETTVRILERELTRRGILPKLVTDGLDTASWEQLSIVDEA